MAQWINVLWNNCFVNSLVVTCLCDKTRAVALAQPDFMASRLTDEMLLHLEFFKIIYWPKHWKFISIQKGTV